MSLVSVLCSSYDGLSDCWAPFCHGIAKYWPDCPYPAYLINNVKNFEHEAVSVIKVVPDRGWSRNLLTALDRIDSPYILYFQEDYWIKEKVNTSAINDYVSIMETEGFHYIRLLSFPKPDRDFPGDERLGIIATESPYRTSVQASLWRKEVFRELIEPAETVWDFEVKGTQRSRRYGERFLSVKPLGDDPFYYGIRYVCTAVNRGRWSRQAKPYAEEEGIEVNFNNLETETWWHVYQRSNTIAALLIYRTRLLLSNPALALKKMDRRIRGKNMTKLSRKPDDKHSMV
jgi:hypothetical protein